MNWLRRYADEILAGLTAFLAAGHLAHVFSQEWLVLLSALLTFIATFTPQEPPKEQLPTPQQQRPGGSQK